MMITRICLEQFGLNCFFGRLNARMIVQVGIGKMRVDENEKVNR